MTGSRLLFARYLYLAIGLEYNHETAALWSGQTALNSGRSDLTPSIDFTWRMTPIVNLFAGFKRPFAMMIKGGQLEMPWMVSAGASVSFQTW